MTKLRGKQKTYHAINVKLKAMQDWLKLVHNKIPLLASWDRQKLTHWGRDKMPAIFQKTFSNAFSWMKINVLISIKISLKFVPKG